ncbi:phosphohydrolase [Deltaproteobacteria bacterium Smac51]|nr:phosphohydrolase [Deltaproteobacteria bacterium Smac51]
MLGGAMEWDESAARQFDINNDRFDALRTLGSTLNEVSDLDMTMETVLSEARRFIGAEAGSIYVRRDGRLILSYAQNDSFDEKGQKKLASYVNQELPVNTNSMASFVVREGVTLNVPDAYNIEVDRPYRFKSDLDKKTGYTTRSTLSLPLKDIRSNVIGVLQLINRRDSSGEIQPFDRTDEELMLIFSTTAALALERTDLIRQMLLRSIKMAELRDHRETVYHAQRVGALAAMLYGEWAARRNLDPVEVKRNTDNLRMAAMLHDVGKVGVSDSVLNKPGRLTQQEREEMQRHVQIGIQVFAPIKTALDEMIADVILNHHERWDGRGYPGWIDPATGLALSGHRTDDGKPKGKKGEEISIFGRVAALADVFDALSSTRVYKDAFDEDLVCQILMQESGHHFDPELVDILLKNLDNARTLRERFPE